MDDKMFVPEKNTRATSPENGSDGVQLIPTQSDSVSDAIEMEFKASPEALAAAEEALGDIKDRSFSGRNAGLGKMINCLVCSRRHRRTDAVYREHVDKSGVKTVTLEPLITKCEQKFKQLWVDENLETGELSIQYATVPLPGQKAGPRAIIGAQYFAKKRKMPPLNAIQNQVVELTRVLFDTVNKERFPEEAGRVLEAKRQAIATIRNRREVVAKRIRKEQDRSRKINRRSK